MLDLGSKVFLYWCIFLIFSLILIYSGNSNSVIGKKVSLIGWQVFAGAALTAPYLLKEMPFESDIMFIIGATFITVSFFQFAFLLKKIVTVNKV